LAIARVHLPLREMKLEFGLEPIISKDKVFGRVSDAIRDFKEDKGSNDL